jgi:hypothetical protein
LLLLLVLLLLLFLLDSAPPLGCPGLNVPAVQQYACYL